MASKVWRCPKCGNVMEWKSDMATSRCVRCAVEMGEIELVDVGSRAWAILAVDAGQRVWNREMGKPEGWCSIVQVLSRGYKDGWYRVKAWEPRLGEQVRGFDLEGNEWTGPYKCPVEGGGPGGRHWLGSSAGVVLAERIAPLDSDFQVVDHG